jgi:hypothetical protein
MPLVQEMHEHKLQITQKQCQYTNQAKERTADKTSTHDGLNE